MVEGAMSASSTTKPTWIALAVTLCVLSAAAWFVEAQQHDRATTDDAAQDAVEWVRAGFAAGDAIRVEPTWDDGPWDGLRNAGAGTEDFPFPALLRGTRLDPVDLLRHRRLWIITTQHASLRPETRALLGVQEEQQLFGPGVTGQRYTLEPADLRGRLSEQVDGLTVTRHAARGAVTSCPWRRDRFSCGAKAWMDVRVETRDVDHAEVSWLYAHPGPVDTELRMAWTGLPAAQALLLRVGHTLEAVRRDRGRPATVTVKANDREIDRFTLERHVYTHERRLYTWPQSAATPSWVVSVQSDDADWREVMLEGDLLGSVPTPILESATVVVPLTL